MRIAHQREVMAHMQEVRRQKLRVGKISRPMRAQEQEGGTMESVLSDAAKQAEASDEDEDKDVGVDEEAF
jgi:hypothetical protein